MNWNFLKKLFRLKKFQLDAFGRTDTGKKRPRNEDSFAIIKSQNLFIVADGMGGHKAGDIASQNAVNILADYLMDANLINLAGNQAAIRHALVGGFNHSNKAIMKMAASNEAYAGMGCTMIACYIDQDHIHLCHVGDVRGYGIQRESIKKLTNDHSYAAEYQRNLTNIDGKLPPKNIVSQAIGFPFKDGPEYNAIPYQAGDQALICSDGLWGMLEDNIIQDICRSTNSPEQACDLLISQANEAGGKDNITAITIFLL